ncbi:MAG: hypothetical protein ACOC6M_02305 [Halobacteriota archaeon]
MDTGIKWIAVISIIMLMAGAAVAQGQSGDKAGGTDIGKTGKEIKPDNNDSGKPVQPDERTQKESSSDKGAEEDNEGKSPEKGDGDSKQAGETAKEKIEQKIKEKIEEQVQTGNRGEEQSIEVRERVKEKLEERIHHARNASENAKQQYTEAKQKYAETKQKGNPDLEQAQAMMQAGTGYMTAWLDRIELQVLDASNMDDQRRVDILEKIEEYQNQTREKREMINNTTSIQELRDVGKDLNDYWSEVQVFIKSVGYQIAAAEMDNIIGNARGLEVRVAEKIAEMDAADTDTSKLEELLNEYQEKVNAAKENVERAQDVLFNASTIEELAEGQNLFQEATNQIRQAFKNVQQMANEYQGEWRFFGNETGEVFATGDGTANVSASGIVVVKGNGSINVTGGSVITTGFGEDFTGDSSITGEGVYVVRGDSVSVNVSGEDIYLFTKGQGSVNLTGNWSYRIKQLPQSDMVSSETTAETLTFGGQ